MSRHSDKHAWWKEAIVYQIYPRSFKDSNADGVGDLRGIIQQLDYLQALGVDAVWLNPVYPSPNADGGYDISNYCDIQPEFGSMADFDELLAQLKQRGMRLIMDVVVNHSSDEHPWFMASRQSKSNPYRDYYFWRPGKKQEPPNNWPSFFGGSAWQFDSLTGEYYLHLFSHKQPDLNWENESLRKEIHQLMRFWLDKGVDGLRLDVISAISKRTDFPDTTTSDFNETIRLFYANGPRLKEFIAEMREAVWNQYNCVTVGEGPGITTQNAMNYLHPQNGLNMIFHFGHMFIDQGPGGRFDPVPWTMHQFKEVFRAWDAALADGWGSVFLGNHDFARMVSRWGNDKEHWKASAQLLGTLLLSMRGTPFIFQGDELGMTNMVLTHVSHSQDIETQNGWREAQKRGISEADFLKAANYAGRDNARTPVQWTSGPEAGFTTGRPWMPVNPNKDRINAQAQQAEKDSVWAYYQQMIRLRKQNPVLVYGAYQPVATGHEKLFSYFRVLDEEKWLVVLNFSDDTIKFPDLMSPENRERMIGNYPASGEPWLRPWEALIFKCK
ncbi:MAG: glycoside hydrolase family 13 protein [Bacteroidota bacterium]